MSEDNLNLETLDMPETETPVEPVSAPEPVAEPAQPRDPATGQFATAKPAEPAAPEPAPATVATPAPTVTDANGRVVPLAAHLAERARWQQKFEDGQKQLQELNQRIAQLEPKPQAPDFVEDPKGYVDAQTQAARDELKNLKEQAEQLQQQQQFSRFTQEVGGQEAAFIQQNPDYYDALGHVRNIRAQQLTLLYPTATQEQITQTIAQEELQAAAVFMQQGRNPAECAFEMAKALGYRKAAELPKAPELPKEPAKDVKAATPPIPKAPVADPSATLGSSGAPTDDDETPVDDDDGLGALNLALNERFGARA